MKSEKNDLLSHWLVAGLILLTLVIYLVVSHLYGHELQQPLPESDRLVFRSVFYVLAIIGFPIINLIRHIQLRLNQTMPSSNPAKTRYFLTVTVSMLMLEAIGTFGFVMFMLGDDFNTLYLFIGLSCLGVYLYRPKRKEYENVIEALEKRQ